MPELSLDDISSMPFSVRPFAASVCRRLSADDGMYEGDPAHYLGCGASALNAILASLSLAGTETPRSILDFGAGAGRVTRWLRAAFPDSAISACDLRAPDMAFCAEAFDARTWISSTDIASLGAPGQFDIIWAGSVVTHLSERDAILLIEKLLSWVGPEGLLVFTTSGRAVRHLGDGRGSHFIHAEAWTDVVRGYDSHGFGYSDYRDETGYGISLTKLSWVGGLAERIGDVRLVMLAESAWDTLQDVVALQKRPMAPSAAAASDAADVNRDESADRPRHASTLSKVIGIALDPPRLARAVGRRLGYRRE